MSSHKNPPQKQTGNAGNPAKRKEFTAAKSGGEREALASMIQRAVGDRAMPPEVNKKLEPISGNTRVGKQNTRGVKN